MNDYTKLAWVLKRKILNFSKNICKGLKRPEEKLVINLLYGIAESGSCHLSKIGRALKEKITLKKTIDRMSVGLKDFSKEDAQKLQDNYNESIRGKIDNRTVYVIDLSDVTKPYSEKLEGLARVHDGSTGGTEKGYWTMEIAALTAQTRTPLPVYDRVYSTIENGFISEDDEVLNGLHYVSKTFGKQGIRALDRGFDALIYYEYFIKARELFVIRSKKNRNVRHNGKTINIMELANQYKGKYSIKFKDKKGKDIHCKIAVVPVSLPKHPKVSLHLVVVYGFGKDPMLLLTNLNSDDKRLADTIIKVYLMRWRIEEYFRFKKQQYALEDFRVRSLNAIRTLHRVVTLLAGLIGVLSDQRDESLFVMELIQVSKRIYPTKREKWKRKFFHYAVGDAFFMLLRRCSVGISAFLRQSELNPQLSFLPAA
jgi:hypothetical protein